MNRDPSLAGLTDAEYRELEAYAESLGMTVEEAASYAASKGLEKRMRRGTKKSPAGNVVQMRRKR